MPGALKEIQKTLNEFNEHYSKDNISMRDNWIKGVNHKLEENDKYMQSKVNAQLDKLIGKGNYIATVSTFLTQAPIEKSSILFILQSL